MRYEGAGNVRRLALAGFVSTIGSEMSFIALAFVIYDQSGSGLWLAFVFLLTFGIPGLLVPVAGVLADRFDRKRVMVASDLASAVAFTALAFTDHRAAMLGIAFVGSVLEMPFGTSLGAALPNLVTSDDLARANSTLSLGRKLASVVGPVLGGALVQTVGAPTVFALNAASFVVSSGLVLSVKGRFSEGGDAQGTSEFEGAAAGIRFIRARPRLFALLVAWTLMFFAVDIVLVAQLPLAEAAGAGAAGFGLILAAWGLGQVVGALAGRAVSRRAEGRALTLEMSTATVSLGVLPHASARSGGGGRKCDGLLRSDRDHRRQLDDPARDTRRRSGSRLRRVLHFRADRELDRVHRGRFHPPAHGVRVCSPSRPPRRSSRPS